MFLVVALLNQGDPPQRAIARLRQFGVPDPWVVRARSAAAALSADVPVFGGLRSLAAGMDEDRTVLISAAPFSSAEEAERVVNRIQLEMDADEPPMGRVFALPLIG